MPLIRDLHLGEPDAIYQRLVTMHDGLSVAESAAANARLVLLLVNHIGDADVIHEAIEAARDAHTRQGRHGPAGA